MHNLANRPSSLIQPFEIVKVSDACEPQHFDDDEVISMPPALHTRAKSGCWVSLHMPTPRFQIGPCRPFFRTPCTVEQGDVGESFYVIVEGEAVVNKTITVEVRLVAAVSARRPLRTGSQWLLLTQRSDLVAPSAPCATQRPLRRPVRQKDDGTTEEETVEVNRLRKGDYFGELSLLTDKPRAATVTAVGDVDCICLDTKGAPTRARDCSPRHWTGRDRCSRRRPVPPPTHTPLDILSGARAITAGSLYPPAWPVCRNPQAQRRQLQAVFQRATQQRATGPGRRLCCGRLCCAATARRSGDGGAVVSNRVVRTHTHIPFDSFIPR